MIIDLTLYCFAASLPGQNIHGVLDLYLFLLALVQDHLHDLFQGIPFLLFFLSGSLF
jgi:hypothetical protein